MKYTLNLSGRQHKHIESHLFPGDGKEAAALLLCGRRWGCRSRGLVAKQVVPIPYVGCSIRTENRIEWPTREFLLPLVEQIESDRLGIVLLHSHPTGLPAFSATDDASDRKLFRSIYGWFDDYGYHASAIMLPGGRIFGRVVTESAEFLPLSSVRVAGDDIRVWRSSGCAPASSDFEERVEQAFGTGTLRLLRGLTAAVVGCSGTGSVLVEQLMRTCVGNLILVDPELVEATNLSRMPQATMEDARAGRPKVDVLSRHVSAVGLGTRVETFSMNVADPAAARAVASADVVFGCMDSVEGRHVLSLLASAYLLPYFDLGTDIRADGQGGVSHVTAAAHYIQPGGSSLLSREVYTPEQLKSAAYRRTNPELYEGRVAEGYLPGLQENQPAVITLNSLAVSLAIADFLARLHGFRLDPNSHFASQIFSLTHGVYDAKPDSGTCPFFLSWTGAGDEVLGYIQNQQVVGKECPG